MNLCEESTGSSEPGGEFNDGGSNKKQDYW